MNLKLPEGLKKALAGAREKLSEIYTDTDPSILLCPNVPKPLHRLAPRNIYGDVWWNKTRKEAYASTDYHCKACGVHKLKAKFRQWLEGHELYEVNYQKGTATYIHTVPLCHGCHNYIHDGRLTVLLQTGKIHHGKYAAILQHGDNVLKEAGLKKMTRNERELEFQGLEKKGKIAPWHKWRLILDGKEYPTPYKNYEEWYQVHRGIDDDE